MLKTVIVARPALGAFQASDPRLGGHVAAGRRHDCGDDDGGGKTTPPGSGGGGGGMPTGLTAQDVRAFIDSVTPGGLAML
jgi:hypothetical protein